MSTRQNIRPRPVDVNKPLAIVRELSELDETESSAGLDSAIKTDGPIAPPPPQSGQKKPKPKEIPVPVVLGVPSYTRDYLPTFDIPQTYLRGKGGTGWLKDDYVEYDLDEEDEDWLAVFNGRGSGCPALPDSRFEKMLFKLEVACSEATEKAHTAACTPPAERNTPSALSTTMHLPKDEAIAVLKKAVGGREQILSAVYDYWAAKRKRWGKPILRRLQAPTLASDTNPFNVFRVREKVNRPLTRRRRDNGIECLEKMRQVRDNLISALEMAELIMLRERKKRAIHMSDINMQKLQLALHHQPPGERVAAEKRAADAIKEIMASTKGHQDEERLQTFVDIYDSNNGDPPDMEAHLLRTLLRKRKQKERALLVTAEKVNVEAISKLPQPPPEVADQEYVFAMHPNPKLPELQSCIQESSASLPIPYAKRQRCWRVGRGGRLMLTRVDPLSMQPLVDSDEEEGALVQPLNGSREEDVVNALSSGRLPTTPGRLRAWSQSSNPTPGVPVPEPWAMVLDTKLVPELDDRAAMMKQMLGQRKKKIEALVETALLGCCPAVQAAANNALKATGSILAGQADERAQAIASGALALIVGNGLRSGREGGGGPGYGMPRKLSKSLNAFTASSPEGLTPASAPQPSSFEAAGDCADGSAGPPGRTNSVLRNVPSNPADGGGSAANTKKTGGKGASQTSTAGAAGADGSGASSKRAANRSGRGGSKGVGDGEGDVPSLPVPIPVDFE